MKCFYPVLNGLASFLGPDIVQPQHKDNNSIGPEKLSRAVG
jgi:hypothetical protein